MAKNKSPYLDEYRKARKNLLQNLRRMKQRGYDISSIKVPDIPKRITEKAIKKLEDINKQRYDKAKFSYLKYSKKKKEYTWETVKGKRGQKVEKAQAQKKAKQTREHNKIEKELNKYAQEKGYSSYKQYEQSYEYQHKQRQIERYKEDVADDIMHGGSDEPIDIQKIVIEEGYVEESPDISVTDGTYVLDQDTGEYIQTENVPDYKQRPDRYVLMSASESDKSVFDKAMHNFDMYSVYTGSKSGKKHDAQTRTNAENIRDFIKEQFEKDPKGTAEVLRSMEAHGAYHSKEYLYYDNGDIAFETTFFNAYFGMGGNNYETSDDTYDDDESME